VGFKDHDGNPNRRTHRTPLTSPQREKELKEAREIIDAGVLQVESYYDRFKKGMSMNTANSVLRWLNKARAFLKAGD
jgi:hypothetical protein